jgi:hypothetical protein
VCERKTSPPAFTACMIASFRALHSSSLIPEGA